MKLRRCNLQFWTSVGAFAAVAIFWIFSSTFGTTIRGGFGPKQVLELRIGFGEVCLSSINRPVAHRWLMTVESVEQSLWINPSGLVLGFGHAAYVGGETWSVPLWLPLWGSIGMAVLFYRKGRARAAGLCANCGYDIRANRDRCPECGTDLQASR